MNKGKVRLTLFFILAALLVTLVPERSMAAPPGQIQIVSAQRDITYCKADGVELKMDVYATKAGGPGPLPAVVYVHGGSWRAGDKAEAAIITPGAVAAGYVVASINYRLVPQYRWPAQIEDVKCAIRSLKANAALYNIDPTRIGVWGSSAGGHLAALAGLAGPDAKLEGTGGYPEQSSSVQAVVDWFGPTDFTVPVPTGPSAPVSLVEDLLGKPLNQAGDLRKQASPVTYVTKSAPPFLIVHGDKDRVVPISQSQILYDRLKAAGANATFITVRNADHGFVPSGGAISPGMAEINKTVIDFLNSYVRDAKPAPRLFPETGKSLQGRFQQYWLTNGGLPQQGFPISEEMQEVSDTDGKSYTVQYFERAVFEYHPEKQPPYDVLLSMLGTFRYRQKYPNGAAGQQPNNTSGSTLVPETGKRLGGAFLQYWRAHGGVAQQGYPISDEFTEVSDLDGKPYKVQYFERAVFEHHPEKQPPYDVLLSQLGTFRYRAKYGSGETR